MTCNNCSAKNSGNTRFCQTCGHPLIAKSKGKNKKPLAALAPTIRPFLSVMMVVVSAFAFLLFILNTFSILQIPASGAGSTVYGALSEIATTWEFMGESAAWAYVGNILFGLCNLFISILGAFYFLKKQLRFNYYDRFVAKFLKVKMPAFYMGLVGVGGALLQVVCFAFCGATFQEQSWSIGVPWLSWVALSVYAILGAVGILVFNNDDQA